MSELVKAEKRVALEFDESKLDLLKNTICKGSTDDEFKLFVHACQRTGLDPFMRQIHAVKRWDGSLRKEVMSIQTGIDGYRLIAERTGNYAPGKDTTYIYAADGAMVSATSYVKKRTQDGTWHEVSATAYYSEYVGLTKEKVPTHMWRDKPHVMLGKCAEALALRKAFPADLSGIYTHEEMEQATTIPVQAQNIEPIKEEDVEQLMRLLSNCMNPEEEEKIILGRLGIHSFSQVPVNRYKGILKYLLGKQKDQQKQIENKNPDEHVLEEV